MTDQQPDEQAMDGRHPAHHPKRILLFSDGTGNSSAKLFKTNVWRMYEAADLGPPPAGATHSQIAFYDNGVGTSSFKLFAVLGGIFGLGLKRNILTIYRYLCRNYRPGDEIYCFGFSRGAYTIRLVAGLIGSQGIVPFTDEAHLLRQTADAYREFCRPNDPNVFPYLAWIGRFLRDRAIWVKRRLRFRPEPLYEPSQDTKVPIAFIGVWDTVAAYGGPIAEITRAIDDWVWPLTMTDQQLCPNVVCARHALALDDERDSFWPVLWDEVYERRMADAAQARLQETADEAEKARLAADVDHYTNRLKQVWFAGMHADVGGGYPDESLSYVSLRWMMVEAFKTGLRLLPDFVRRVDELATEYGPIHDSREGAGSYYRYQPRKIAAFLHPRATHGDRTNFYQTLSLRDPRIGEKKYRPQGLLLHCNIHESVIARIQSGTDGYAPLALPQDFTVTHYPGRPIAGLPHRPRLVSDVTRTNLALVAADRWARQEVLWNRVWTRRLLYFATLITSFLIVLMPVWAIQNDLDGRSMIGTMIGWIGLALPSFAKPWIDAIAGAPFYFLGLLLLIGGLMAASAGQEDALRDAMRKLWHESLDGIAPTGAKTSVLRSIRSSRGYQFAMQFLKWRILPNILGPAMLLFMVYLGLIIWAQAELARDERAAAPTFCPLVSTNTLQEAAAVPQPIMLHAAVPCTATGVLLHAHHRYRITMAMREPWQDGPNMAPVGPDGEPLANPPHYFRPRLMTRVALGIEHALLTPFRRIVDAPWLAMLYEVRPDSGAVHIDSLPLVFRHRRNARPAYIGEIEPATDGALMLFANDAALPGDRVNRFYRGEAWGPIKGWAETLIVDLDAESRDPTTAPPLGAGTKPASRALAPKRSHAPRTAQPTTD